VHRAIATPQGHTKAGSLIPRREVHSWHISDATHLLWDCENNRRTMLLFSYIFVSFRNGTCIFGLDPKMHKKDHGCEEKNLTISYAPLKFLKLAYAQT
jgi:hypothetical protein